MSQGILGPKLANLVRVIMQENPRTYIEIGTYRMHTFQVVNLLMDDWTTMYGFDLFEKAPDSEVAPSDQGPMSLSEAEEIVKPFQKYVYLIKGDSLETLKRLGERTTIEPVVVFIDGGHSKETLLDNFKQIREQFKGVRTTVVIDDLGMPGLDQALEEIGREWKVEYKSPFTGVIQWD